MLDFTDPNEMFPLDKASNHVPGRPHRSTCWRWAERGVIRNGEKIRLETISVGGRRYTSQKAIDRFIAACNPPGPDQPMSPNSLKRPTTDPQFEVRAKAAGEQLTALLKKTQP